MPAGSNLVKVKASTYSSSGTPYCRPSEIGDGEVVHHRAEGSAFLVHVDEDLAEAAVVVFAGAQVHLVAADDGLLGVALAAVGSFSRSRYEPLDDPLDDLLGHGDGARGGGLAPAPRWRHPRPRHPAISEELSGCESLEPSR
jgi:hypothetical protein